MLTTLFPRATQAAQTGPRPGGHVSYKGDHRLTHLPSGLAARSLDLTSCVNLRALPDDLQVSRLTLSGCKSLTALPPGLRCYELDARETGLERLPSDLRVEYKLDLSGCTALRALPTGLKVGSLLLTGCTALMTLPEGLDVYFLDISGCARLQTWPERAAVRIGRLNARGCAQLSALPPWLTHLAQLDIRGCAGLKRLPDDLRVSAWLDIADSGIESLPASLDGAALRWRGIPIDARIAFRPETITATEILATANAERRRVLLERKGYEAFMAEAHAQTLDTDRDPGGERRLLRVPLSGDEDLVCVSVFCPSTGRQYIIRVPPRTRTCHQAAAWIAGFDDADDYRPLAET